MALLNGICACDQCGHDVRKGEAVLNVRNSRLYCIDCWEKIKSYDYQGQELPSGESLKQGIARTNMNWSGPACMTLTRKFTDKTEEQAIREIMSRGITRECILEVKMTRHEENKVVEGEGKNNDEAMIKAESKIPRSAVDINEHKFIRQAEQGTIEIQAEAEWQARKQWDSQKEKDAQLDVFQCITTPRRGIFGIGRRIGLWKISWSKPLVIQFSYRIPSEVTITFTLGN